MRNATATHYHHADGSALGGRIHKPFDKLVPVKASLSLPPVGGHTFTRSEKFDFEGLFSFESAQTEVSGTANQPGGPWTTVVTAMVDGFNFNSVITADRIVARIMTEHPADGGPPKVSFVGTQFVNVRVSGVDITPELNLDMCSHGDTPYPTQSCLHNPEFHNRIREQRRAFDHLRPRGNSLGERLSRLVNLHPSDYSDDAVKQRGFVACSLVQNITGDCPGNRYGHVLEIADIGYIYFGELIVDFDSFQLIPIRLELGCAVQGDVSVSPTRVNGKTVP